MKELDALIGAVGADVTGDEGRGVGSHALGLDLYGPIHRGLGFLGNLFLAAVAIGLDLSDLGLWGEDAGSPGAAEPEPRDNERDRRADCDLAFQGHLAAAVSIGNEVQVLALAVLIVEVILIHDVAFL